MHDENRMNEASGRPPRVALLALGGTIAMSRDASSEGVVPALDAVQLAAAIPALAAVARVEPSTLMARPSASLTTQDVLDAAAAARRVVGAGVDGVVITQGTDTLEETAFLLDLVWDQPEPLVVTGAMRNPTEAGADGPANVLAAVTAAASPSCRGLGCLVVMNDEIHAARYVQKQHASSLAAFVSPDAGPLGSVAEGRVRLQVLPAAERLPTLRAISRSARVALVEATFDDGGELLAQCSRDGYDGIVIAALGVGHLSEQAAARAIEAAASVPVVLTSRTGAGGVRARTYGFPGSESHLLGSGLLSGGMLSPRKARILLLMLIRSGADANTIKAALASFANGNAAASEDLTRERDGD